MHIVHFFIFIATSAVSEQLPDGELLHFLVQEMLPVQNFNKHRNRSNFFSAFDDVSHITVITDYL